MSVPWKNKGCLSHASKARALICRPPVRKGVSILPYTKECVLVEEVVCLGPDRKQPGQVERVSGHPKLFRGVKGCVLLVLSVFSC